jgi:hypothetical protein
MRFLAGNSDKVVYKDVDISGIKFHHNLIAATAGTAINTPALDWSKINVKILLHQRNKSISMYTGNLLVLLMSQAFFGADWEMISPVANGGAPKLNTTVANAAGVKQISTVTGKVDFGQVLNLRGSDYLEVTVNMDSQVYDSTVDSGVSYMLPIPQYGIGLQMSVPVFRSQVLTTADETPRVNIGDNCKKIFVLNTDKQGILATDQVVKNVRINSDRYKVNYTYEELINERVEQFESKAVSDDRSQNFVIFNGLGDVEIDQANLELDLNISNVNTGKNYVFIVSYYTDFDMVNKALQRQQKHEDKFIKKMKR